MINIIHEVEELSLEIFQSENNARDTVQSVGALQIRLLEGHN